MSKMTAQPQQSLTSQQTQAPSMSGQEQQEEQGMGNSARQEELGIESEGQGGSPRQQLEALLQDGESDPCDVADAFSMMSPAERLALHAQKGDAIEAATKDDPVASTIVASALTAAVTAQGQDVKGMALRDGAVQEAIASAFETLLDDAEQAVTELLTSVFEAAEAGQDAPPRTELPVGTSVSTFAAADPMLLQALGSSAVDQGQALVTQSDLTLHVEHTDVRPGMAYSSLTLTVDGTAEFEVAAPELDGPSAIIQTAVHGPQEGKALHLPGGAITGVGPLDYTIAG
jgi:hypothetical protein